MVDCAFEWENSFREMKWDKLAANDQISRKITKKIHPLCLSAPALGPYACI